MLARASPSGFIELCLPSPAERAVNALKVRSCLIDGEAVACDGNGIAVFELLREKPAGWHIFLYAFDLLELNGKDLRREPFAVRKATLASLLPSCPPGLRLNEYSRMTATWSSATRVRLAWKASYRSGSARSITVASARTG
jgi:ATP-dependent DNA ligase